MASNRPAVKCKAHKTDGSPCANYAMHGATVCHAHGGRARQVRARAAANIAEAKAVDAARAELARIGVTPVTDPLTMLAQVTAEVVAWKDATASLVNRLSSVRYEADGAMGASGGEQLRAEVALWERALDRCERFLSAMARANIDERLAKITERQAEIVEQALLETLAEMGLDRERQSDACARLGRRLSLVA